jgi:hypothetical protein
MTNTQITALITAIQDGGLNTALEVRTVLTAIKNACVLPNEVKWIKLANVNLSTYFNETGLGISGQLYEGWAICNGQNDTTNDNGKVSIAYGTTYTTLGATGGEIFSTLTENNIPQMDITVPVSNAGGGSSPYTNIVASGSGTPDTKTYTNVLGSASPTGVSIMQPYVVELKIQRIA